MVSSCSEACEKLNLMEYSISIQTLQMLRNMSADISEMDDALKTEVKDVMFQSLIPEGQTHCNASGLSKEDLYEYGYKYYIVSLNIDIKTFL